ncbi:GpE family phage tail protein [Shewanella baltica]
MADIAIIFHWPLSEMAAMDIDELISWHDKALDRWEKTNKVKHG